MRSRQADSAAWPFAAPGELQVTERENLNIASIGAGGQAGVGINSFTRLQENIVALCDPDKARAAAAFAANPKAPQYSDFRKMLDKEEKNIDAVLIAVPDFMHGTMAMWCMERGKHVYVQKPMTRCVWEARQLKEAAIKYKVASQMGNQGYCQEGTRQAAEMIWSGAIGDVTEAHAWTNRPVWQQGHRGRTQRRSPFLRNSIGILGLASPATRPYSTDYVPFQWRGWFDFGCGALGDMACHVLGRPEHGAPAQQARPQSRGVHRTGRQELPYLPQELHYQFEFPGPTGTFPDADPLLA